MLKTKNLKNKLINNLYIKLIVIVIGTVDNLKTYISRQNYYRFFTKLRLKKVDKCN